MKEGSGNKTHEPNNQTASITDLTFLSARSNIFRISPEAVMKVMEFSSSPCAYFAWLHISCCSEEGTKKKRKKWQVKPDGKVHVPLAGNPKVRKGVNDNEIPRFRIGDEGHQEKGPANFLDESCLNDACLRIGLGEVDVIGKGIHTNVVLGHGQKRERRVSAVWQASECLCVLAPIKNLSQQPPLAVKGGQTKERSGLPRNKDVFNVFFFFFFFFF